MALFEVGKNVPDLVNDELIIHYFRDRIVIANLYEFHIHCHCHIQRYSRWLSTTYHLATTPHDWHSRVRNDPSRSSKVDGFSGHLKGLMRLSISDQ